MSHTIFHPAFGTAKPTFEIGKRYRTRDGRLTEPLTVRGSNNYGSIDYSLQAKVERDEHCDWRSWTAEGTWLKGTINPLDLMPGAIDDQPKFEAGKSYRTREGGKTGPLSLRAGDSAFVATLVSGPHSGQWGWNRDGASSTGNISPLDLLPGAIEDEKEAAEPWPDANVNDRLTALEAAVVDRERMSDLRQIHSRLNRQAEKIETIRNVSFDEWAKLNSRTEALTRELASHRINTASLLLDNDERLDHTNQRVDALEKAAELTAAVNRLAAIKPQPTHPAFDPPKPTIKGGWVNVYRDRSGVAARIADYVWADKEDADAAGIDRIACIQIPDIQEGEGL